jgi:hypothetical protein
MEDADVVARQLGRRPRAFRRVVHRCRFGLPAVTEQAPYDVHGEPFPTTYYLTCPHLVAAVSRLEAAGGVERWSEAARDEPALAASLAAATAEQRRLRRELAGGAIGRDGGSSLALGIGGASRPERLKCLHAHVAFALARPGYELGERILAELEPLWPAQCCSEPPLGGDGGRANRSEHYHAAPVDAAAVEHARQEWEESSRRLEAEAADRRRYERLLEQVEAVRAELRRRIGETYTLAELAELYAGADAWTRDAVEATSPPPGWPRTLALVEGAAFHRYARGAVDYAP